jgi:hypothetical protein
VTRLFVPRRLLRLVPRRLPRRAVAWPVTLVLGGLLLAGGMSPVAASSGSSGPSTGRAAAKDVSVTVNPAGIGSVGTGFAGFSYEKDRVGADVFDVHDTNLVNLFRLLGPSVLRIGGNLVDIVNWNPHGAGGSASEIAPPDVTKLAAFLKATGWKVIYGINLKTNTPANAASEAQFAAHALGSSLLSFSIGNEPEFYKTESSYQSSFDAFVAAIRAKDPDAVFDGPEVDSTTSWLEPFAAHEKDNALVMLSMHDYIGDNTKASVSGMLASNPGSFSADETAIQHARSANGIPQWRMTEANSYYHGGANGVSNVAAAALWSLDFMYGVAAHGGAGVNFHGGTSVQFPLYYSPITYSGIDPTGVQGVYYGELLWALAGPGVLHPASVSGGSDTTAWGIGRNVIVNNKSGSPVKVSLKLGTPADSASVYVLTAPSLTSKVITIAGSAVSVTGAFTPAPALIPVVGTTTSVTIPAGSAALLITH